MDSITPIILTFNEAPNIARTLSALRWAKRVVILDSGSTDETERIARTFPNVDWRLRHFDSHAKQWLFAINGTNIDSDWALALDADMVVPEDFPREFERQVLPGTFDGGVLRFTYRVLGRDLLGSLYPPDMRAFRRGAVDVIQDGHTQRFLCKGPIYRFQCRVAHDDRKTFDRWIQSQVRYSSLEAAKQRSRPSRNLKHILRDLGVMPLLAGLKGYVQAGGFLRGTAALEYAYERVAFETLLAMRLLRQRNGEE